MSALSKINKLLSNNMKEGVQETAREQLKPSTQDAAFGRLDKKGTRNINFNTLAQGHIKMEERYKDWEDGISNHELDPDWIKKICDDIADIYGLDSFTVIRKDGWDNIGIEEDIKRVTFGPSFCVREGNAHGPDALIGYFSHEVGHQLVHDLGLRREIPLYDNELCADYIAGLTARLCKLNPDHLRSWYNSYFACSPEGIHPGSQVRLRAFNLGYTRIDRGPEATSLKVFEDFSPYDSQGVYRNHELVKQILKEDILDPLEKGEIKKI